MTAAPNTAFDLDELAAWASARGDIRPADLQRVLRLTFSQACTALEALQARGDLERIPGAALAWRPVPPDLSGAISLFKAGRSYSLPLSQAEHGALLRALEERLNAPWLVVICREGVTEATFFDNETTARSFFDQASAQWSDSFLTQIRTGPRDTCGHLPEKPDRATLRQIRSRLLGKEKP